MAITGNERFAGAVGLVARADLADLTGAFGVIALVFMMRLVTGGEMEPVTHRSPSHVTLGSSCDYEWVSSSLANCRTDLADLTTNRWVLAI